MYIFNMINVLPRRILYVYIIYVCVYNLYIYIHIYIYIYMCVCVCVCLRDIFVYIHHVYVDILYHIVCFLRTKNTF